MGKGIDLAGQVNAQRSVGGMPDRFLTCFDRSRRTFLTLGGQINPWPARDLSVSSAPAWL
jgi:hypothetical protein